MRRDSVLVNWFYVVLVGVCGTLLVTIFLTGLMAMGRVAGVLPWIVGFNAALAAFNFLERGRFPVRKKGLSAIVAALTVAFVSYWAVNGLGLYWLHVMPLGVHALVPVLLAGGVGGSMGALLAIKYFQLQ